MSKNKKKEAPVRGLLDYLDITIGRVSDSDASTPGKRKRSWGATVMLFCMLPAFTLVFSVAFNLVFTSVSIKKELKASIKPVATKTRRVRSSPVTFPKPVTIEWPIVFLASLILLVGVAFSLFRRKQDLDRAIQLGKMISEVKHGTDGVLSKPLPDVVKSMYEKATSKIGSPGEGH